MTTASSSAFPQSTISDIPSLSEITLPNYNFPFKLEHDNYVIWKSQIHPAIVGCNMESFIDGTTLPPSSTMTETNTENGRVVQKTISNLRVLTVASSRSSSPCVDPFLRLHRHSYTG